MNTTRRIAATALATAALVAPAALSATAVAAPDKPTKPGKPAKTVKAQTKQLLKDIAGKDKRLARLSTSNAVETAAGNTNVAADNLAKAGQTAGSVGFQRRGAQCRFAAV